MAFLFLLFSTIAWADGPITINSNGNNGSGFVFQQDSQNTVIATNFHVCISNYESWADKNVEPKVGKIFIRYKGLSMPAKIIATDRYNDVCLLITKGNNYPKYRISPSANRLQNGTNLVLSAQHSNAMISTSYAGTDANLDKWAKFHKNSRTMIGKGIHGDSGSPVLNSNNEVIGIFWGIEEDKNISYFVPIDIAWKLWNNNKLYKHLRIKDEIPSNTQYYDGFTYGLFQFE